VQPEARGWTRESQNPQLLEVRFRATLGQEPEIELMLVLRLRARDLLTEPLAIRVSPKLASPPANSPRPWSLALSPTMPPFPYA
jgi:hypothetical protein